MVYSSRRTAPSTPPHPKHSQPAKLNQPRPRVLNEDDAAALQKMAGQTAYLVLSDSVGD